MKSSIALVLVVALLLGCATTTQAVKPAPIQPDSTATGNDTPDLLMPLLGVGLVLAGTAAFIISQAMLVPVH